jgi:hypothetical protein
MTKKTRRVAKRQRRSECPHDYAVDAEWINGWRYTCAECGALMPGPVTISDALPGNLALAANEYPDTSAARQTGA